jgi:hypothetical protein
MNKFGINGTFFLEKLEKEFDKARELGVGVKTVFVSKSVYMEIRDHLFKENGLELPPLDMKDALIVLNSTSGDNGLEIRVCESFTNDEYQFGV